MVCHLRHQEPEEDEDIDEEDLEELRNALEEDFEMGCVPDLVSTLTRFHIGVRV